MHHRRFQAKLPPETLLFGVLAFFLFGCDGWPEAGLGQLGTLRIAEGQSRTSAEDVAANDLFESAQSAELSAEGSVRIDGTIDGADDIDIYALGPGFAGDRITVDVSGANGLNTVAALFNAEHDLIDANDDRSYYAGQLDPFINQVLRADTPNLFVGIAVARAAYFSSQSGRFDSGSYRITVSRRPNQPVPAAVPQIVFLDFRGGAVVQIAQQPVEQMRPFSAEVISQRLAGQTDSIADRIISLMRSDYEGLSVVLYDSRHDAEPTGPVTRLYFGNFNRSFLGLSDNVDTGNLFLDQKAIIYTEDFSMFEALLASPEEIAQAIANTGSHELGHLLGLEHAADPADIMATAASARQILETDAVFQRSRLEAGVFPAGWQNDLGVLIQNVGGLNVTTARMTNADRALSANPATSWRADYDIAIPMCGRCQASGNCGDALAP